MKLQIFSHIPKAKHLSVGAALVESALLVALIGLIGFVSVDQLGRSVKKKVCAAANAVGAAETGNPLSDCSTGNNDSQND